MERTGLTAMIGGNMELTPSEQELINSIRHSADAYVRTSKWPYNDFKEGLSMSVFFMNKVYKAYGEAIEFAKFRLEDGANRNSP